MKKPIFLIDADGVLLDYNKAFKTVYEKMHDVELQLVDANAYHAVNMWGVNRLSKEDQKLFYAESAKIGMWRNMSSLPGSVEFVNKIAETYEVICLTSMPTEYENDRLLNLQNNGCNISRVIATSRISNENPKKRFVEELNADFFIDDLIKNFKDINASTKLILLDNGHTEDPNKEHTEIQYHYKINKLNDFFKLVLKKNKTIKH